MHFLWVKTLFHPFSTTPRFVKLFLLVSLKNYLDFINNIDCLFVAYIIVKSTNIMGSFYLQPTELRMNNDILFKSLK